MANASNALNLQSTPEELEHMGDSPSKDLTDSSISQSDSSQKVNETSSQPDFEISSLTTASQSITLEGTDCIETFREDRIQATVSKQNLYIEENTSKETCEKISKITEEKLIAPPFKISNSVLLSGEMEVIQPIVSEETVSTEVIQPIVSEETVSTEVIQPIVSEETVSTEVIQPIVSEETGSTEVIRPTVFEEAASSELIQPEISQDSESTELIQTAIFKETGPSAVIKQHVSEVVESTKLIHSAFSKEAFESEVIQPALSKETVTTKAIQFYASKETRSTELDLPDISEVNGSTKIIHLTSSEVKGSTKIIQPVTSKVNGSTEEIQPVTFQVNGSTKVNLQVNSGKTKSTKVIKPPSTEETLLQNVVQSPLDSLVQSSEKGLDSSGTKDQIPQKNVINLSALRRVSTEKITETSNFLKQPNSSEASDIELDSFSVMQVGEEFKNGTCFIVSGVGCGGLVTATPSPIVKPIFPDFQLLPLLLSTDFTMDTQSSSNVSALPKDVSSKTSLPAMNCTSPANDAVVLKEILPKTSMSTMNSTSPTNDSAVNMDISLKTSLPTLNSTSPNKCFPKDISSKTSLYTLLSILMDWINTGIDNIFNRPNKSNIGDLLDFTDKKLAYGQNMLNQMDNRVHTLLKAVAGLPDHPVQTELSGPKISFRDCLNDAGTKVRRRLQALKAEITEDYDKFVIVCRVSPEINKEDFVDSHLEAAAFSIISNSYVKVSEEYSNLKLEIEDFRNKIKNFYLDINRWFDVSNC